MASTVIGRLFADFVSRTDKFTPGARRVDRQLGQIKNSAKGAAVGLLATNRAGAAMGLAFGGIAGAVAAVAYSFKAIASASGNFEAEMLRVKAITKASGEEFTTLRELAQRMGATTEFSASQAAEGIRFLGMAGFSTNQILQALPATLQLASAGALELGRSADIVSNIMGQFLLSAGETQRVVDVMAATITSSNTDMEQMAEAMKFLGPTANALGISIEEAAASIGILGDAGLQGSIGTRALATALVNLTKPEISARLKDMLDVEAFEEGKFIGMARLIDRLNKSMANLTDQQKQAALAQIFGGEAIQEMNVLLNAGAGKLDAFTEKLRNSKGTAEEMANIGLQGLFGQMKLFGSSLEALQIKLGDTGFLGLLTGVVKAATWLITKLGELNPVLLRMLTPFGNLQTLWLGISKYAWPPIKAAFELLGMLLGPLVRQLWEFGKAFALAVSAKGMKIFLEGWRRLEEVVVLAKMGVAGFGAVALQSFASVLRGLDFLIDKGKEKLNLLIMAANELPGINLATLDVGAAGALDTAAASLEGFRDELNETMRDAAKRFMELRARPPIDEGLIRENLKKVAEEFSGSFGGAFSDAAQWAKDFGSSISDWIFAGGDSGKSLEDGVDEVVQAMERATDATEDATDAAKEWGQSLQETFADGIANARSFGDAVGSVLREIRAEMIRSILLGGEGDDGKRSGGVLGAIFGKDGFFGKIFGKPKANGGSVSAGTLYPINERGMEFFQPSSNGRVIPVGGASTGGGVVVNMNVDARGADNGVAERLMVQLPHLIKTHALAAVMNEQRRRGL